MRADRLAASGPVLGWGDLSKSPHPSTSHQYPYTQNHYILYRPIKMSDEPIFLSEAVSIEEVEL